MSSLTDWLNYAGVCGDESTASWDDDDWLPHCQQSVVTTIALWFAAVGQVLENALNDITSMTLSFCDVLCATINSWLTALCDAIRAASDQIVELSTNLSPCQCTQAVLGYLFAIVVLYAVYEASKWIHKRLSQTEEITIDLRGMSTKDSLNKVDTLVASWSKNNSRTACIAQCHADTELRDTIINHLSSIDRVRVQRLLGEPGSVRFWVSK